LTLSDRIYICDCGLNIDRDINAVINIKKEGIGILKKQGINLLKKNSTDLNISESYACGYMSVDLNKLSPGIHSF